MEATALPSSPWNARQWAALLLFLLACLTLAEYTPIISDKLLHYITETYGSSAEKRILRWQDLMKNNRNASTWSKLNLVNNFFNRIPYESDLMHWNKNDYWATPVEFLATNGGDCEDYAIAKYFTLRELGIPTEKLRITYVIALSINQAHMVLAYYETPDSEPLILDNLKDRVLPASSRDDLQPVYGFNGEGLWAARDRGDELKRDNKDNVEWQDLNSRLTAEMDRANGGLTASGP